MYWSNKRHENVYLYVRNGTRRTRQDRTRHSLCNCYMQRSTHTHTNTLQIIDWLLHSTHIGLIIITNLLLLLLYIADDSRRTNVSNILHCVTLIGLFFLVFISFFWLLMLFVCCRTQTNKETLIFSSSFS